MEYTLVRSARKTVCLEIRPDGSLLVRAPRRMGLPAIDSFVASRRAWVEKHRAAVLERARARADTVLLSEQELSALAAAARTDMTARVERYAPLVGVGWQRISVRRQRTRWGSCSSRGTLSFNCLLMLTPPEVRDYVAVHELCHRKHMDHSPGFWAEVERVLPDWRERRRWLRENGPGLMARLGEKERNG